MARPEVEGNRRTNPAAKPRANGRESEVSQSRDNLADPKASLRTLASALIELAIQILGDEKSEQEDIAA